jgi:PAS domain-containing protein
VEPALTAAVGGGLVDVEPILDILPVPLILVEPGTARMVYANVAAHRMAGGTLTLGVAAEDYASAYRVYDASGRPLRPDEMPAVRAARGETLSHVQVDWETPAGMTTVVVSGTTITLAGGRRIAVVTFEDVTALESSRRRATLLADELRVMLDGVADAITVQSPDHRLIYANAAAFEVYGIPRGRALADFSAEEYVRRFEVTDETGAPLSLAQFPGRLALAGLDPDPVTLRARDRRTGEIRWARIKSTAVRDPDGGVRLAINLIEDITELKRSEESQRFLAEASRRLAGSLDYARTLECVAELAVPAIAEECSIVPADRDAEIPRESLEVMRSGAAKLDAHRMVVPMTAAGRVLGTIVLSASSRRYDALDARVAEDFAVRAGAAVANARLYRAASEIAAALQTSLLPPVLPDIPGAQLAAAYHPGRQGLEVGGDFYDVFSTADGQWYLVIGDVCGKGAEAAAVTALARHSLRTAATRRRSPASILRWVGEALHQHASGGRFCTIACAHVDLTRRPARVTVACGGHPLPVLRRASGPAALLGTPGTLLGLAPDPELQERGADLLGGDALVLYTDGLTEARAPARMWDDAELLAAVRAAPSGPAGLVESLVATALGGRSVLRDDLAVLALRLT